MGLRIRLRKPGKSASSRRHSKIVVIEGSLSRQGRFVEELGYYDALSKMLKLDIDTYEAWVKKGALPSETVAQLYKRSKKAITKT